MHLRESTHTPPHDCKQQGVNLRLAHATHNFFVGRTAAAEVGVGPARRVMEHETFFYQLHLNGLPVLACPMRWRCMTRERAKTMPMNSRVCAPPKASRADIRERIIPGKNFPEVRRSRPHSHGRCESHQFAPTVGCPVCPRWTSLCAVSLECKRR